VRKLPMPLQSIKAPLKLANSLADRYTTEDRLKHSDG
jgi:hypothetical protein